MVRKIAIVTGSRAEYGYLKPLIQRILRDENLQLLLYVAGMHLVKSHGNTIEEIKKDGFKIQATVPMGEEENNSTDEVPLSIAKGIIGFTKSFKKDKPDVVVVLGDRVEPFSATISAASLNIPVAHINGGDVSGNIDDSFRHAMTKLSHLHFPASALSMKRILKLGEEKWRVHQVGALSLDTILHEKLRSLNELRAIYHVPKKKYILFVYHAVTTEWKDAKYQIHRTLQAMQKIMQKQDMFVIMVYPNTDPGGKDILLEITQFALKNSQVYLFKNLPYQDFLSFMSASSVFVGNSSSGIIEAPSFGIPYVCVGTRQKGRERAQNVIDVDYDENNIIKGIKKALFDEAFLKKIRRCHNPYGNGTASQKIVKILHTVSLNERLLKKRMTY